MNKKISIGAAIALILLAATLTFSITMVVSQRQFNKSVSDLTKRQEQYSYLVDIDKAIRQHYYGTIDEEKLHHALAHGMVDGLGDPYADYLTAEEYQKWQTQMTGSMTGFGIEVAVNRAGQPVVAMVYADSPAQKAGITAGSVINKIDDADASGMSLKSLQNKLDNSESVVLTLTAGSKEAAYKITAGPITVTTVTGKMLENNIGYIRIRSFRDNTPAQFTELYDSLIEQGAIAFVFDVRDNTGGSVEAMQEVLSHLLPSGIYGSILTLGEQETALTAAGTHRLEFSSVTLINGKTQGEAEMFAAVMSKFVASSTVGSKTAGRAMVQSYYTNSADGSAIKLTTGELKVANAETSWEGEGLLPVVEALSLTDETVVDLIAEVEDTQLGYALRLLEPVFNDPDNFIVPTTTTQATQTTTTTVATTTKKKK